MTTAAMELSPVDRELLKNFTLQISFVYNYFELDEQKEPESSTENSSDEETWKSWIVTKNIHDQKRQ